MVKKHKNVRSDGDAVSTLRCKQCNELYITRSHKAAKSSYCSRRCLLQALSDSRCTLPEKITCMECKKRFKPLYNNAKYCSSSCFKRHVRIEERECKNCFKRFKPKHRRAQYCDRKCKGQAQSIYQLGENHPRYTGVPRLTYGSDWPKIRLKIIKRDNDMCQSCGIMNVNFDVHHIIPYKICRENKENNLITLCKTCHMIIETKTRGLINA